MEAGTACLITKLLEFDVKKRVEPIIHGRDITTSHCFWLRVGSESASNNGEVLLVILITHLYLLSIIKN